MIRLAVRVARRDAELVLSELLALAPGGLEERDLDADTVEYAIYGPPGEVPDLPELRAAAGAALVDIRASAVPDDWLDRWRAFHRPVEVAGRVRIRPPWEPRADDPDLLDVRIDPGRAFGTGSHESTRLSLELLLELEPSGALADWGCGSGVLAIAAARLGYAPIAACDVDPAALEATRANAAANRVAIEVSRCDLRRVPGPWAPTVTANLVRVLLLDVAQQMERPPDYLIASGLLLAEADEVAAAFARKGMREEARREGGEWAALLLAARDQPPRSDRPARR
jgi:ribosomal protein L11 methyltransferase